MKGIEWVLKYEDLQIESLCLICNDFLALETDPCDIYIYQLIYVRADYSFIILQVNEGFFWKLAAANQNSNKWATAIWLIKVVTWAHLFLGSFLCIIVSLATERPYVALAEKNLRARGTLVSSWGIAEICAAHSGHDCSWLPISNLGRGCCIERERQRESISLPASQEFSVLPVFMKHRFIETWSSKCQSKTAYSSLLWWFCWECNGNHGLRSVLYI